MVSESDQRRKRIEITDTGRDAAKKCRMAFDNVDHTMYEGFSPEELDTLDGFFARMISNLRATYTADGGDEQ